ncbi:porphobilinogen synthase [Kushneria phyllosphaerae]|uniref:Delta-aminolevulinic acid dehydratase n=1 Tax=Kushneria phyllosphaerae TaxID=2100822 RepID=A0A2R8CJ31_9GAMM|nr:porphobilinogen synthase [Kushneria phyllosphaerae]SPJ32822.1 Delta-aminolevulinic acid dehydratase [Kushneria phyllosphaerae]
MKGSPRYCIGRAFFRSVRQCLSLVDNLSRPLKCPQRCNLRQEVKFAAAQGVIDESAVVRETLGSMRRAGADLIMTYFAPQLLEEGL